MARPLSGFFGCSLTHPLPSTPPSTSYLSPPPLLPFLSPAPRPHPLHAVRSLPAFSAVSSCDDLPGGFFLGASVSSPSPSSGRLDDDAESSLMDAWFPWERPMPSPEAAARVARSPAWMAELTLRATELRLLRHAATRIKLRTKVGGAGVTREVVEKITEKWRTEEVVRIKVSDTPALNMRLFHEILEVCCRFG